jgi:TPR repeat protein
MRYYNGDDVLQDYTRAVELLKQASEKGSSKADGQLAFIYWTGSANQKRDTALSLSYAQKSGTRKTQMAHQALGALYLYGVKDVLSQNFEAAYSEFMNAYEYYSSMFLIGLMRYHGVGTTEDKKGAAESFFSACKKRPKNTHAGMAALCLGYMYVNGEGVGKNVSEGESWMRWGGKYSGVIPAESIPSPGSDVGRMEGYLAYSGYKMARDASGLSDAYTWPGNMTLLEKAIELYFHRQLYK